MLSVKIQFGAPGLQEFNAGDGKKNDSKFQTPKPGDSDQGRVV